MAVDQQDRIHQRLQKDQSHGDDRISHGGRRRHRLHLRVAKDLQADKGPEYKQRGELIELVQHLGIGAPDNILQLRAAKGPAGHAAARLDRLND